MGRNKIKCVPHLHLTLLQSPVYKIQNNLRKCELMPAKKKRMNKKRVGSV